MKINFRLLIKSFLLSFIILSIVSAIIITSVYMDRTNIDPAVDESLVLLGLINEEKAISLTLMHFNPKGNEIKFLPIPDNTWMNDNCILQDLYSTDNLDPLITNIDLLTGAKIDRYLFLSVDALSDITDRMGKISFYISNKFVNDDSGSSYHGMCDMNGELVKTMFTYRGYDHSVVSMSDISLSFLMTFLSESCSQASISHLESEFLSRANSSDIISNISSKEIGKYCELLSSYQTQTHTQLNLRGETHINKSSKYFIPEKINSNQNIFD